jgi:hypothetical protein
MVEQEDEARLRSRSGSRMKIRKRGGHRGQSLADHGPLSL